MVSQRRRRWRAAARCAILERMAKEKQAIRAGVPWPHGTALLEEIASTRPVRGSLALWHLGQSGFVAKGGDVTLYFDPFLSPSSGKLRGWSSGWRASMWTWR
ncbi:MAG: hypothetical protein HY332_06325 [Chloroflexi bacterium]|nr:hypothetical protein [Chloroflexota bacterium]